MASQQSTISSNRPVLYRALDFPAAWKAVVRPWLRDASAACRTTSLPAIVLVPTHAYAKSLRHAALCDNLDLLGIHFQTPADYWRILHDRLAGDRLVADRPELHLLLSAAADRVPSSPAAAAVARDPAALMRAIDMLSAAGWQPDDLGIRTIQPVLDSFEALTRAASVTTAQILERTFPERAGRAAPLTSNLLIIGFDSAHWPLWNVLHAAVLSAGACTACLFEPRPSGELPDETWIEQWEHAFGEAEPVPDTAGARPFRKLTEAAETGGKAGSCPAVIRIGMDEIEEARAVVTQALLYLSDPACAQVGILVPGPGVLAREVGRLLNQLEIPHDDAFGQALPPTPVYDAWQSWMQLQQRPGIAAFLDFIDHIPDAAACFHLDPDALKRRLQRVYDEIPVDDMTVMAAALELPWPSLPERADLDTFLRAAAEVLTRLHAEGLMPFVDMARDRRRQRLGGFRQDMARDSFLRWLADLTRQSNRTRGETGNHAYARVGLLGYDRADWRTWSHLILAGLNEKAWPPESREQPFLGQQRIEMLNRRAMRMGDDGEGTALPRPGKGLILGPAERSALYKRSFYNIVESATHGLCFTASMTRVDDPARPWMPSELLVRAYAALHPEGLSGDATVRLQAATAAWLREAPALDRAPDVEDPIGTAATAKAFHARRNADAPPDEYCFGLREAPLTRIVLSCTAWQESMLRPELVWMRRFLGVEADTWSPAEIPFPRVTGIRVHNWIHDALRSQADGRTDVLRLPDRESLFAAMTAAQERTIARARRIFRAAGRDLPEWWRSAFDQARGLSRRLLAYLADFMQAGHASGATEWRLPPDAHIVLPDGSHLPVQGRIDLILHGSTPDHCTVIDYKTGGAPSITAGRLGKGEGLQVLLYALALLAADTRRTVEVAVAHPGEPFADDLKDTQELLADRDVQTLLAVMGKMQRTGVFGMKGEPRTEFGQAPSYPLATLRIDPDVLQAKWERFITDLDPA